VAKVKVKVRFLAINDHEEELELELQEDWTYTDIEDAYDAWLLEEMGEGWEILEGK